MEKARISHVEVKDLLTLREIEQRHGVHYQQVYAWAEAGLVYVYQVGGRGRKYYSEPEIIAALGAKRDYPFRDVA